MQTNESIWLFHESSKFKWINFPYEDKIHDNSLNLDEAASSKRLYCYTKVPLSKQKVKCLFDCINLHGLSIQMSTLNLLDHSGFSYILTEAG